MTTEEKQYKDLLAALVKGYALPEGCDRWAIRSVHPDFRSSRGYRWPFPGQIAKAAGPFRREHTGGCPSNEGDGICAATSWRGMASGGIPAVTLLLVAYASASILGSEDREQKVRVTECHVVDVVDGARLLREKGAGANLGYANLGYANLGGANLRDADLGGANLRDANLRDADLGGANLGGANLRDADLGGANLGGANLGYANLGYANLRGANLRGANLGYANLGYANLGYANLGYADLRDADLRDADLRDADLRDADLGGALANEYTTPPAGWTVREGVLVEITAAVA